VEVRKQIYNYVVKRITREMSLLLTTREISLLLCQFGVGDRFLWSLVGISLIGYFFLVGFID
jgi:hypothetical protein